MITFTFTVQLESVDLTDLIDNANWNRLLAALSPSATIPAAESPPRTLPASPRRLSIRKQGTKATERPVLNETSVLGLDGAGSESAHEIAAIGAAQEEAEGNDLVSRPSKRNTRPQPSLPFADFDKLARSEIKRLSMDGRIPSIKLWDSERDRRLPTYTAVLQRYKLSTLADLAALVGLEPPLRGSHAPLGIKEWSDA
jgi:hypothetical protein